MDKKRKPIWAYWRNYAMIAPFFILFIVFYLAPIFYGFYISFHKWDGVHPATFVGIDNYINVITSRYFIKAFTNLIKYVLITMFFGITIAFALAVLVNHYKGTAANILRSGYFLPTVIPLFLTAAVWRWIVTPDYGMLNRIIVGLGGKSINWLTDPKYMIQTVVIIDVWRSTGFNMIILLAGLKAIPDVYYEAAEIDGANGWQKMLYITIPQLEPVLFLVIVNGFISALQIFDIPWLITQSTYQSYGGPLQGMMFPVMDIMGRAFGSVKLGEASAYSWILLILILGVTLAQFRFRKRYSESL
jgi:multiple sugar transport system permease protein